MKTYIPYSLILAAAASGLAYGAETAYTTPVGYVSSSIPASGDATVGQPVRRASLFQGLPTSVVGNVIGGAFTENAFTAVGSYLQVNSGPLAGRYFEILSNTATTLTVDSNPNLQTLGVTNTTNFSVIPYWTLNTLFPSGAGVGVATDLGDPKGLASFRDPVAIGVNKPTSKSYFYYNGPDAFGPGWYDNDDLGAGLQNDLVLDPSVVAYVRNNEAIIKTATVSGTVPAVQIATPILTGTTSNDNYVTPQLPVDITLAQSGLAPLVTATDLGDVVNFLFVYDEAGSTINKPANKTYFYYSGVDAFGPGWYDNDDLGAGLQDNVTGILKAGRAYVLHRNAAGAASTTQAITPLPYTL